MDVVISTMSCYNYWTGLLDGLHILIFPFVLDVFAAWKYLQCRVFFVCGFFLWFCFFFLISFHCSLSLTKARYFLPKTSLLPVQTGFLMCCYFKVGFRVISYSGMRMNESDRFASMTLQKTFTFLEGFKTKFSGELTNFVCYF